MDPGLQVPSLIPNLKSVICHNLSFHPTENQHQLCLPPMNFRRRATIPRYIHMVGDTI